MKENMGGGAPSKPPEPIEATETLAPVSKPKNIMAMFN